MNHINCGDDKQELMNIITNTNEWISNIQEENSHENITHIGWFKMGYYDETYLVMKGTQIFHFMFEKHNKYKCDILDLYGKQLVYKDNMVIISDYTNSAILKTIIFETYSQLCIFKQHLDLVSNLRTKKQIEYANKIIDKVNGLIKNPEVRTICLNFLKNFLHDVFLYPNSIKSIEKDIFYTVEQGEYLLLTDRNDLEKIKFEKEDEKSFYDILDDVGIKLEQDGHKLNKHLEYLADLLNSKYEINSFKDSVLVSWQILYRISMEVYWDEWNKQYGDYFIGIDELNLKHCLEIYCDIDIIDSSKLMNPEVLGRFIYYLIKQDKFEGILTLKDNYLICYDTILSLIPECLENKQKRAFERLIVKDFSNVKYSIHDIDTMNGREFESFIAHLFSKMGYSTTVTKSSGDQGIDVIAEKNGKKIGIQAKCYSGLVSNSAIQEAVAGINYYKLDQAIVITNNYFTKSAQELAKSNNVILWDRNMLKEKLSEIEF
ncbi:restriction endonuclease [Acetivibrio clariflavus]|uniref:restriction endonuclease n=1 Tax=Acetivibrio clariflavus TaxID=288965 RepID=UPI0031F4A408